MGLNDTGTPNVNNYNLGRGIGYIALLDANDLPTEKQRDLGNIPSFTTTVTTESLQHQSSRTGFKTTDVDIITSREQSLSFELEEQDYQNLALFLLGTATENVTNAAVAGFAEYTMATDVVLGRWYNIQNSSGVRAYGIDKTKLTVEKSGAPDVALVENTDYTVDEEGGRIFLLHNATNIAAGDEMDVTLAADGTASAVDQVSSLTGSAAYYQITFMRENPVNSSKREEWVFRKVQLGPNGDLGLVSDEIGKMGFSGRLSASGNALHTASPYLLVTDMTP